MCLEIILTTHGIQNWLTYIFQYWNHFFFQYRFFKKWDDVFWFILESVYLKFVSFNQWSIFWPTRAGIYDTFRWKITRLSVFCFLFVLYCVQLNQTIIWNSKLRCKKIRRKSCVQCESRCNFYGTVNSIKLRVDFTKMLEGSNSNFFDEELTFGELWNSWQVH